LDEMDINIEIWCTKCNSKMDTSENVYCESCIDAKDEPDKIIDGVARLNCDEKELAKKYTEKIMVWFFKNRERYFRDILYEDAKNIVEKILQSRQPELFSELAEIIKWLYTSEKVQLAQSDITKIVNRLEAIEKLLQSRQPTITRREIEEVIYTIFFDLPMKPSRIDASVDLVEGLFKSKGFEVKGRS